MADVRLEAQDYVETKQYIVVQIGNEKYGIDIQYIDNIVRMSKILRLQRLCMAKRRRGVWLRDLSEIWSRRVS